MTPANLAVMQQALKDVVTDGHREEHVRGLGRAGRRQDRDRAGHRQGRLRVVRRLRARRRPEVRVVVLIEQGGHGASVAGPAARMILAKLTGQPVEFVRTAADQSR